MSVVLGIECSQRLGGVALQAGEGQVSQERLESASGVDDQLMLAIDRLFRQAGQAPSTLELIGLSIGPGGFTGLRVAVSTARMLAMTTGCRIVPVPSAIVAAMSQTKAHSLAVMASCKHDTAWLTRVDIDSEGLANIVGEPGLVSSEGLKDLLDPGMCVLADTHFPSNMNASLAALEIVVEEPQFHPEVLIQYAQAAATREEILDSHHLEPLYAREPEAVRLFSDREQAL